MYVFVCQSKNIFVKNKRERSLHAYIHVYVSGYVWVLVCLSHLIYWSFKSTVGVLTYLSVSDLISSTCVVFVEFVSSVSPCMSPPSSLLNQKFLVSYTLWVDRNKIFQVYAGRFYFKSTKVQMYGHMCKYNLWSDLTNQYRRYYLFLMHLFFSSMKNLWSVYSRMF